MNQSSELHIDVSEEFPHLSRPGIKEAVIAILARASVLWNEEEIRTKLKLKLSDYPQSKSVHGFMHQLRLQQGQEPTTASKDLGWQGLMFTSSDNKNIVQFQQWSFLPESVASLSEMGAVCCGSNALVGDPSRACAAIGDSATRC